MVAGFSSSNPRSIGKKKMVNNHSTILIQGFLGRIQMPWLILPYFWIGSLSTVTMVYAAVHPWIGGKKKKNSYFKPPDVFIRSSCPCKPSWKRDIAHYVLFLLRLFGTKHIPPRFPSSWKIAYSWLSDWWFQPLWTIWKSVGVIIPNWMEKKENSCSKPPTRYRSIIYIDPLHIYQTYFSVNISLTDII